MCPSRTDSTVSLWDPEVGLACDLGRSAFHVEGMITDVSLRLLHLILERFLA
jgi:hypothetical protein